MPASLSRERSEQEPVGLSLQQDEIDWLKHQTGIYDTDALKQHVILTQRRAWQTLPYLSIQTFDFCRLRMSRHPVYEDVLRLGRERPGAVLLDLGCCFGNDVRKAVADGFPASQVLASDFCEEFWELGCDLFRDLPGTVGASFVACDASADNSFSRPPPSTKLRYSFPPGLGGGEDVIARCVATQSLGPLHGRAAAIHISGVEEFSEDIMLMRRLYALLSPERGSLLFGEMEIDGHDSRSAVSLWREMWKIIAGGEVKVDCWVQSEMDEMDETFDGWDVMEHPSCLFTWSITRL